MPAPLRTTRDAWVSAGIRALAAGGTDAVRIESLARRLGATKGSFYHHFADRRALLDAMLARWEQTFVDEAIEQADAGGGDGRIRLRRLFRLAGDSDDLLAVELSIRDWARRDPAVAERVTRVDNRRLAYLRPLFAQFCADGDDVEGRCLLVLTFLVGDPLVNATHRDRTRPAVAAAAMRHLLR